MIYFTSDLHIGHDKPFIWKDRGFISIEEHDTAIMENWNNTISDEDTVFILGDLCLSQNEKEWDRIYNNLKGKKNFIIGNHDTPYKINKYEYDYHMENLGLAFIYKYTKTKIFYLSHYPTYTANFNDNKPIINLFGHTHQSTPFFQDNPHMYNVGVDANNMTPISIEQIIYNIKYFKGDEK